MKYYRLILFARRSYKFSWVDICVMDSFAIGLALRCHVLGTTVSSAWHRSAKPMAKRYLKLGNVLFTNHNFLYKHRTPAEERDTAISEYKKRP